MPELDLTQPNFSTQLISLGVTGGMTYGPLSSTLPENLENYVSPFTNLGWISDEGITEALNEERNDWIPWQSTNAQRGQVSSQEFTFAATVWSIGGLANALYYGVPEDEMLFDETSGVTSFIQGDKLPEDYKFRLGIDIIDGDKARRFLVPAASVQDRGEIVYTKTELIGYQFTFKTNLDAVLGYSIRREFKEGWQPGVAGSVLESGLAGKDLGDWSAEAPVNP